MLNVRAEHPGPMKRRKGWNLYVPQAEVWAQGTDRRKLMCQFQGFPAPNPLFRRELRGLAISTKQLWCASASCKQHPCKSPARQPPCKGPDLASSHYFCLQITINFTGATFWVDSCHPQGENRCIFFFFCPIYAHYIILTVISGASLANFPLFFLC